MIRRKPRGIEEKQKDDHERREKDQRESTGDRGWAGTALELLAARKDKCSRGTERMFQAITQRTFRKQQQQQKASIYIFKGPTRSQGEQTQNNQR